MKIKTYLPAIIVVSALAGVGVLWWVFNPPKARVVSVIPAPAAEGVERDVVGRIVFDREIEIDWAEMVVLPEVPTRLRLPLEKRSLIFTFQEELAPETVYTVSVAGKKVAPFSWSFKTRGEEGLEGTEGTEVIEAGGKGSEDFWKYEEQLYQEDPLLFLTPVLTEDYKITRLEQGKAKIDLYAESTSSARLKVFKWFEEHELDPEDFEIIWVE